MQNYQRIKKAAIIGLTGLVLNLTPYVSLADPPQDSERCEKTEEGDDHNQARDRIWEIRREFMENLSGREQRIQERFDERERRIQERFNARLRAINRQFEREESRRDFSPEVIDDF